MSFGAILGQMMQQGLSSRGSGGGRLQDVLKNLGAGQPGQGGGANDLFGQLQTMLAGAQSQDGIATQAKDFLTKGQVGGVTCQLRVTDDLDGLVVQMPLKQI
ncbi:hypothetical protein CNY89_04855 [Amaricoccus sp. HAR-UPW-R2A-40]|nr:hypothetical protein CNY89_04855 [Amaricoccus sp. HAR-UPW-R2A-40]